jgi:iron-sulfur cluster repair protein YtfE (RIC family)
MKKDLTLAKLTPDATLAQIVTADPEAGELLSSIGLKPGGHENQTLRSVCQQRQWNEVEVLKWIKKQRPLGNGKPKKHDNLDFRTNLSAGCEYLKEEYHAVNLHLLEEIADGFLRVHKIHGNQYPWLKHMPWHFERLNEALGLYYEFEAKTFFPLVDTLQQARGELLDGTIRKLERCIEIVNKDQDRLRYLMRTLLKMSNKFASPEGACTTLRTTNQNLKSLFSNLHRQFEVEKETLLPAVQQKIEAVHL